MEHAEWAGEMAKQMRIKKLTGRKLAELTGYTNVYISMVLGGSKTSSEARKRIEEAILKYDPDAAVSA